MLNNYFICTRKDGKFEIRRIYNVQNFPYHKLKDHFVSNGKRKNPIYYVNKPCAFDIETTTYLDGDIHRGFMYVWQVCLHGYICGGRTWESFFDFLKNVQYTLSLCNSARQVIYIHNESFEFQFVRQFLKKYFGQIEVFATDKRKPLKVVAGGFEFRCSYKLSNMTLAKACLNELNNPYLKASGDLDYAIYRDCYTPLTDLEHTYCFMDVLALYYYIIAKMANEGDNIATIPLTSTAYVRRECRETCRKDKDYMKSVKIQALTPKVYDLLKQAGRGGDTAANRFFAGAEIANCDSYDATSSYPYQLCNKMYPMRKFYPYGKPVTERELNQLCADKPVLIKCVFEGLKVKKEAVNAYLSFSKNQGFSGKTRQANGRVLSAESIAFTLTDVDWRIVQDCYTWDSISVSDVYTSKYSMLPLVLRQQILLYFRQKCELKNKLEKLESLGMEESEEYKNTEYLYNKSKNRLNGIFGMMYTDPVRDAILYDEDAEKIWDRKEADVSKELLKTERYSNNFLIYAWGVWTTAHAREHLHLLRNTIGDGSIYWDTDSDKCIDADDAKIDAVNQGIIALSRANNAYVTVNGKDYYMGVFEKETKKGKYQVFKTLGAKKYAYVDYKGKLHVTISGVTKNSSPSKLGGADEMGTISNFKPGFTFKKAGGLTLYYNDEPITKIKPPKCKGDPFTTGANIGTENSTYTIGITQEYAEIIGLNLLDTY